MGDVSYLQSSFSGGEWSKTHQGRFDLDEYETALNVGLNIHPTEEGAAIRRSGFMDLGATKNGAEAVLREFHANLPTPVVAEVTPGWFRFWQDGQVMALDPIFQVTDITSAFPAVFTTDRPHGYSTGRLVRFILPDGMSALNDAALLGKVWELNVTSANTFTVFEPITFSQFDGTPFTFNGNPILVNELQELPNTITAADLPNVRFIELGDRVLVLDGKSIGNNLSVTHLQFSCNFPEIDAAASVFSDGPYLDAPTDGSFLTPTGTSGTVTLERNLPAWDILHTYAAGDAVVSASAFWVSLKDANLANAPASSPTEWAAYTLEFVSTDITRAVRLFSGPAPWDAGTAYTTGQTVSYNGAFYQAVSGSTGKFPDVFVDFWVATSAAAVWTWGRITAVNSATNITLQLIGGDLLNSNPIGLYRLGVYCDTVGWPTCGCFDQGRLWLGGAVPNRIDSSKTNDVYNFSPTSLDGTVADDNAITAVFNAPEKQTIHWMVPNSQGIICGTYGGEWLVQASNLNDPITPTSISARRHTAYGSAFIEPLRTGMSTTFVQTKGQKFYELLIDGSTGRLSGTDLSIKARHLTATGFKEIAYQIQPVPLIWAAMNDGSLISCTYKRESPFSSQPANIAAWTRHALASGRTVRSVAGAQTVQGNEDSIMAVTKDADGFYHVERSTSPWQEGDSLAKATFLDGVQATNAEVVTVMGLTYVRFYGLLPATSFEVFGAGLDLGTFMSDTNGTIDIPLDQTGFPLTTAALVNMNGVAGGARVSSINPGTGPDPNFALLIQFQQSSTLPDQVGTIALMDADANRFVVQSAGHSFDVTKHSGWLSYNMVANDIPAASVDDNLVDVAACADIFGNFYAVNRAANHDPLVRRRMTDCSVTGTFGNTGSSLPTSDDGLALPWDMCVIEVGNEPYIVSVSALAAWPNTPANTVEVAVVNGTTMEWTGFSTGMPSELRADICRGPDLTSGCQGLGMAFIMGHNKFITTSTDPLNFYAFTFSGFDGTGKLRLLTSFNPADIDPTWTHINGFGGMGFDEDDNTVIFAVSTDDAVAHPMRMVKVDGVGLQVWNVPIPALPNTNSLGKSRIRSGRYGWFSGSLTAYTLNTITGAVASTAYNIATVKGGSVYDGRFGAAGIFADFTTGGNIVGAPNSNFSNTWGVFLSLTLPPTPQPEGGFYSVPFVFGADYNSDGQILRRIKPETSGARNGPALAKTRRNHMVGALVGSAGPGHFSLGTTFTNLRQAQFQSPGGNRYAGNQLYSGIHWTEVNDDNSFDGMLCWRATGPFPGTMIAFAGFEHSQDR